MKKEPDPGGSTEVLQEHLRTPYDVCEPPGPGPLMISFELSLHCPGGLSVTSSYAKHTRPATQKKWIQVRIPRHDGEALN